jgi:hypothetical protein
MANGVHSKIAQARLGHYGVAITRDLHSHVSPRMQADAVARADESLRAALEKCQSAGWDLAWRRESFADGLGELRD